jgi:hypothetical protein
MARDISEGIILVTERTLRPLTRADLEQLGFELERALRDLRGTQYPMEDIAAIQQRNRRLTRLTGCASQLRAFRQKNRV